MALMLILIEISNNSTPGYLCHFLLTHLFHSSRRNRPWPCCFCSRRHVDYTSLRLL